VSAAEVLRRHAGELSELTGMAVTVIEEGSRLYAVLEQVPLPPGAYKVSHTDVLFVTDQQYPLSAMDMFWTQLEVLLPDGRIPANADSTESHLGRQWRRFSWHRNGSWNPSGNPLLGHYSFMEARFAMDVAR
jgi:hypothetical protein